MDNIKKIIIFGFPHCGTTVLKNIISRSQDIYSLMIEVDFIQPIHIKVAKAKNKRFVLIKHPFTIDINDQRYDDYIKIFIIRNPYYVMSSLYKRFWGELPWDHSFAHYEKTLDMFLRSKKENMFSLKYEDMFLNNYKILKDIFDKIGFKYTDEIFDNSLYNSKIDKWVSSDIKDKPSITDHGRYRTWQINQPFENMNYRYKINLTKEQQREIDNSIIVKELGYTLD